MNAPFDIAYFSRDPCIDPQYPWLSKVEADAFRGRNIMTNEQVAFAFLRELQKRFSVHATLSDIEIAQEQGWRHDVEKVCAAYEAAQSSAEPKAPHPQDGPQSNDYRGDALSGKGSVVNRGGE
jgi:hypothetical protein